MSGGLSAGPLGLAPAGKSVGMGPLGVEGAGGTPPGLRDAEDEMKSCGSCAHFREEGVCSKFNGYPCESDQVCDAHERMESSEQGELMEDPGDHEYR